MNLKRKKYLLLITYLHAFSILFLSIFIALILNFKDQKPYSYIMFVSFLLWLLLGTSSSIVAIINFNSSIKSYLDQHLVYKDDEILLNLKREKSALIMSFFSFLFPFNVFVSLNAFLKSGLKKGKAKKAKEILISRKLITLAKEKKFEEFIKENNLKEEIDNILFLESNGFDNQNNLGKYMQNILLEKEFDMNTIELSIRDIYYEGFNI